MIRYLYPFFAVFFVLFIFTQVVIPSILGEKIFPFFRKQKRKLLAKLEDRKERKRLALIQKEIRNVEEDIKQINASS